MNHSGLNHSGQCQHEDFSQHVQDALAHLYDHMYLQQHVLARLLAAEPGEGNYGRTLHRILIEAIGELKPSRDARHLSAGWRKYQYLVRRYLEGRSAVEAAEDVGISERQARRYHHEATEAIVSILWERYRRALPQPATGRRASADVAFTSGEAAGDWSSLLQNEIARIGAASASTLVSVDVVLDSVIAATASLAQGKGVHFRRFGSPDVPPVSADRVLLRQILFNVTAYAIHRASPGSIIVTGWSEAGTHCLEVRIDSSARLPTGEAEPKPRVDQLQVARQLLARTGGTLDIGSADGQEVLRLELPAASPVTVLVVDDNPDIVQLFRRFLSGRPYQVAEASSGAKALEAVRTSPPEIIILDVMMPDQDGWELLQLLRNLPETQSTPIVVCSVLRERELAISLGAAEFLSKPVTQQALLLVLDRCLAPSPTPPALPRGSE